MKRVFLLLLFCCGTLPLIAKEIESDKEDQVWGTLHFYQDLGNGWVGKAQFGDRRDREGRQSFHSHVQAGIEHRSLWWCWIPGVHYRYVEKRVEDSETGVIDEELEHQAFFDLFRKWSCYSFTPSIRSRLQYKSLNKEWAQRIRGEILLPKGIIGAPFFSSEWFWGLGQSLSERRTILGIEFSVLENHSLRVGLMQRLRRDDNDVYALRFDWTRELPSRGR
jgi:hypothetical protein